MLSRHTTNSMRAVSANGHSSSLALKVPGYNCHRPRWDQCSVRDSETCARVTKGQSGSAETGQSQVMKPAHVVHVHSQLPLNMVALGSNGEYIVSATIETWEHSNHTVPTDSMHLEHQNTLRWSENLPDNLAGQLRSLIDPFEDEDELTFIALSKTKGVFDGFGCAKSSSGDRLELDILEEICSVSGTERVLAAEDSLSAVIESAHVDVIKKLFYAPDHGWYMEAKVWERYDGDVDTVHEWRRLPESLDAALRQYHDAYRGVSWLSVGTGGEWFVKYKAGFYQWYGLHPMLDHLLRKGRDKTGEPDWVELGHEKTFVAQFKKCTAWYAEEELSEVLLSIASF